MKKEGVVLTIVEPVLVTFLYILICYRSLGVKMLRM